MKTIVQPSCFPCVSPYVWLGRVVPLFKKCIILLIFSCPLFSFSQAIKKKIWIDTDNRMGKVKGDVDDGLALMLAFADSTIAIQGISTVGNVTHARKITLRLLNWYGGGKEIQVFSGAKNSHETGIETDAMTALKSALVKDKLILVSLGPATNIASLLQLYPEVIPQIEEIVFCMGRSADLFFKPGNGKRILRDYNFEMDTEAMRQILKTNVKVSFVGFEAASSIYINKNDLKSFRESSRTGDKWVYRQLKAWSWKWRIFLGSNKGFIPFDAVTMGYVLIPEYLRCEDHVPVAIEVSHGDKNNVVLLASKNAISDKKVNYCNQVQVVFKDYLLRQLGVAKKAF